MKELHIIRNNAAKLLNSVGRNAHRAVAAVLLENLTASARRRHFPLETNSFLYNARNPKFTSTLATQEIFTRHYTSNVTRGVKNEQEVDALLFWCKNIEFSSRSGDTTETYYRVCSKEKNYYEHYRGREKGFLMILEYINSQHPGIVDAKSLRDAKLTRYHVF